MKNTIEWNPLEIRDFLDEAVRRYECPDFIPLDPISVPHRFTDPRDIEIAGLLTATIAWGRRPMILRNAIALMERLDNSPFQFITQAATNDLESLRGFVHRTFNGDDLIFFIGSLADICREYGTLGDFFRQEYKRSPEMREVLTRFHARFFTRDGGYTHGLRTLKHLPNPEKRAACKRLNMFLRWMVRSGKNGVDFGLWRDTIPPSALYLPLDVHSGAVARALGLLERKQDDWKAVEEVTRQLRKIDPVDPVRYDFALFGAGVSGYLQ